MMYWKASPVPIQVSPKTRVPLYPYQKEKDENVFFYSHRRLPDDAKAATVRRPKSPSSRPGSGRGTRQRPQSAGAAGCRFRPVHAWDARHHVTNSRFNETLSSWERAYFGWWFENENEQNAKVVKWKGKLWLATVPATADGNEEHDEVTPEKAGDDGKNPEDNKFVKAQTIAGASARLRALGWTENSTGSRSCLAQARLRFKHELEERMKDLYQKTNEIPSLIPFADFYLWCINTFGNLARCWRTLDTNKNMQIHSQEFLQSLQAHGFKGEARFLFRILDRDKTGMLKYVHFDPCGADDLASLVEWCTNEYGSVQKAFNELDEDKNGKIQLGEFQNVSEKKGFNCIRSIVYVFEMLDLDKDRRVSADEMEFLDRWHCPGWLRATPDNQAWQEFKDTLLKQHHHNPIKAWNLCLDTNRNMRVHWEEFERAWRTQSVSNSKCESVWRAVDVNLSGWLSLKEFDERANNLLQQFKKWCGDEFDGVFAAFTGLDYNHRGTVNRKKFQRVANELNLSESDADLLFKGLDLHDKGHISKRDLKYLDDWDIDADHEEESFWDVVTSTMRERRQRDHKEDFKLHKTV